MNHFLAQFGILVLPLILSGALHMVAVKLGVLRSLARPVNRKIFGANKTWRGFILMPFFGVLSLYFTLGLQERFFEAGGAPLPIRSSDTLAVLGVGISLGLAYVIFELPNSFLKRRLGIPPGAQACARLRPLFFLLDRLDSAIGCTLTYFLFGVSGSLLAVTLPASLGVHLIVTFLLSWGGIKDRL